MRPRFRHQKSHVVPPSVKHFFFSFTTFRRRRPPFCAIRAPADDYRHPAVNRDPGVRAVRAASCQDVEPNDRREGHQVSVCLVPLLRPVLTKKKVCRPHWTFFTTRRDHRLSRAAETPGSPLSSSPNREEYAFEPSRRGRPSAYHHLASFRCIFPPSPNSYIYISPFMSWSRSFFLLPAPLPSLPVIITVPHTHTAKNKCKKM